MISKIILSSEDLTRAVELLNSAGINVLASSNEDRDTYEGWHSVSYVADTDVIGKIQDILQVTDKAACEIYDTCFKDCLEDCADKMGDMFLESGDYHFFLEQYVKEELEFEGFEIPYITVKTVAKPEVSPDGV